MPHQIDTPTHERRARTVGRRSRMVIALALGVSALAASASSASAGTLDLRSGGNGPGQTYDPKTLVVPGATLAIALSPVPSSYAAPLAAFSLPVSRWVSTSASGIGPAVTTYEVRFELPAFSAASLQLKLRAENWVRVTLNPDTLSPAPTASHGTVNPCLVTNYNTSGSALSLNTSGPGSGLLPGLNVLRFRVVDCAPRSALNFAGRVTWSGTPAPAGLDHFKCYTVKPKPIAQRQVTLTDQFGTRIARVHKARQVCNPVRKTHASTITQIQRPNAHLTCRRTTDVSGTFTSRRVRLANQFGIIDTKTTPARTLCLPSLLRLGWASSPTGSLPESLLDHFRCYGVEPRNVPLTVGLKDKFGATTTKVKKLVSLCTPVRKIYNAHITPYNRPAAHLACYTIDDLQHFGKRKVVVRNQFGVKRLRATKVATLCLPTRKYVLSILPSPNGPLPPAPTFAVRLTASHCSNGQGVVHTVQGTTDPARPGAPVTAALTGPRVPTGTSVTAIVAADGTFTAQTTTPATAGGYPVSPATYRWTISVADPELAPVTAAIDTDATREPLRCTGRSAVPG